MMERASLCRTLFGNFGAVFIAAPIFAFAFARRFLQNNYDILFNPGYCTRMNKEIINSNVNSEKQKNTKKLDMTFTTRMWINRHEE